MDHSTRPKNRGDQDVLRAKKVPISSISKNWMDSVDADLFVFFRANIDEVETEVVEIEAKLDKVRRSAEGA